MSSCKLLGLHSGGHTDEEVVVYKSWRSKKREFRISRRRGFFRKSFLHFIENIGGGWLIFILFFLMNEESLAMMKVNCAIEYCL